MDQPTAPLPTPDPAAQPAPARPRRRTVLLGTGIAAVAAAGLLVGLLVTGSHTAAADEQTSAPTSTAQQHGHGQHPAAHGRHHKLGKNQSLLVGTVSSVQSGKLVVTRDSGGDATVSTDSNTKVRGSGVKSLSDLKPGQRVVVKVQDGKALAVGVPAGHATGTVTALDGDKATLVEPDGLQVTVDVSGVSDKPKVGDLVAVKGTANGTTLKATALRELPKS